MTRFFESRDDRTRTCDSLVPNQERYQLRYIPNSYLVNLSNVVILNPT